MRYARQGCFLIATLGLTACSRGNQDILNSAGIQAKRIENLWWLLFWVTLVVFVLVMSFLGRTVARANDASLLIQKPAKEDQIKEQGLQTGVIVAVSITVVIIFGLLVASISAGKAMASLQSKTPLTIEVVGHQWWWEVHYPDSLSSNIVVTANEIHIPDWNAGGVEQHLARRDSQFLGTKHSGEARPHSGATHNHLVSSRSRRRVPWPVRGILRQSARAHGLPIVAEAPEKFQQWLQLQRQPAVEPTG